MSGVGDGVSAVIVAGGAARRMGRDKRALLVDGVPMLQRVALAVASVAEETLIACRRDAPPDPAVLNGLECRLVFDRVPDGGPLAGLEAALAVARFPLVLTLAGDLPWLESAVLRLLLGEARRSDAPIVALGTERGAEPLLAIYRRDVLPAVTALLDRGERRMHALLDAIPHAVLPAEQWRAVDPGARSVANVNEPEDLDRFRRRRALV